MIHSILSGNPGRSPGPVRILSGNPGHSPGQERILSGTLATPLNQREYCQETLATPLAPRMFDNTSSVPGMPGARLDYNNHLQYLVPNLRVDLFYSSGHVHGGFCPKECAIHSAQYHAVDTCHFIVDSDSINSSTLSLSATFLEIT